MKVAITGTIGGGKSQVSEILRSQSYTVYDMDALVHRFYDIDAVLYKPVIALFGDTVVNADASINRQAIASLVFNHRPLLDSLEALVFPAVADFITNVSNPEEAIIFFEVPLLFEANLASHFDCVVMVTADETTRYQRLAKRGLSAEDVRKRSARHMDEALKRHYSDIIIENNGTLDALENSVANMVLSLEGGRHAKNDV